MTTGRRSATAAPVRPAPGSTAPALPTPGPAPRASAFVVAAVVVGGAVLLLALLLAGGRPAPSVPGLPDAGPVTGWALPVVRLVLDLAAVTTVGALLLPAVLLPVPAGALSPRATTAVRSAGWAAGLWSISSLLLLVLTASETVGVPLTALETSDLADSSVVGTGRALLVVAGVTAAAAAGCTRAGTVDAARRLLLLAGLALLPTTVTGHAATSADHGLAVSSLVVHVVAATVWSGGLLAVVLFLRTPSELAPAVRRFSAVALACFLLVAASGLLSAWVRLGTGVAAWTTGYGALVLAKTGALAVLGAMGWQHRRRLVPALRAGRPGAFLSFAGAELAVMGGAFGLAVALSRTPTPAVASAVGPVASHGAGHETLPTTVEPVSLSALLLEVRLDAIVLAVVALLAAAYVSGVRRLSAAGTPWPRRRSGAFAIGLVVAVLALCSGMATYAAAMLSVQVAQFVLLLVGVPALLVLGAPDELLRRVRALDGIVRYSEPGRLARALGDPLTVMVLVAALVFVVYRTGLLGRALGSSELLLLVDTAALAVGLLLVRPALGTDASGRLRGPAERIAPLLAAAASLLLLAIELRLGDRLLAGRWFATLGWSWVDPVTDQHRAAVIAAGGAVLLLALAVAAWRTTAAPVPYPDDPHDEDDTASRPTGVARP